MIPIWRRSLLDVVCMKERSYIAVALILTTLLLAALLIHGASLAWESGSPDDALSGYNGAQVYQSTVPAGDDYAEDGEGLDDGYPAERWGVARIEAPLAWEITRGDPAVIVAVLDTGICKANPELAGRLVAEVNFTGSRTSDDLYGHGTHIAGTIVAIAPDARLMNVKVADDMGRAEAPVVARGIVWAVDNGAQVINISLCMRPSPELEEAVNYAWGRGAIIIAAAGNQGGSDPVYPAYYVHCLAVAGTNSRNSVALLSSHGYWVDVAAPGLNIYSELPLNEYGYKTGTSTAAAHVSGVAALVLSVMADDNGTEAMNGLVREAIENSCTPISGDGVRWGLVNAFDAIAGTLSPTSP